MGLMMQKRKILATGASGYSASQLLPALRGKYEPTLLNVKETDPKGNNVPRVKIVDFAAPHFENAALRMNQRGKVLTT